MNKILSEETMSVQTLITASATGSASAVVAVGKYANIVATAHVGKLVDNKGALGVTTLSLYETIGTGLTGSIVTAATVTMGLISNSAENLLQTEIKSTQLSDDFKYVYAHIANNTVCDTSVVITRGHPRFSPQN